MYQMAIKIPTSSVVRLSKIYPKLDLKIYNLAALA
jgi:hypothetical protein